VTVGDEDAELGAGGPPSSDGGPPARFTVTTAVRRVHLLSLGLAALLLLYDSTTQWFHVDEWDFLAHRGLRLTGNDGLLYPHDVHWSTIPILVWRGLFNLVGVRDYWLYSLPLIVASLVVAHVLWRLMLRYQVEPWTATALVGTLVVIGVGSEDLLWAFQLGFVGSLAFGLLAVEATEDDRPWLAAAWGLGALLCSGMGVPLVAAGAAVALARRRFRVAVIAAVPPAVIFLSWWVTIGHRGGGRAGHVTVGSLASYVWTGLTASAGGYLDLPRVVGAVLVVALAGAALWRRDVPAVLAVMTVPLYLFVGVGRVGILGPGEAAASRYSYFTIALLLPLVGELITSLLRWRVLEPVVLTGLVVVIGINLVVLQLDANTRGQFGTSVHKELDAAAYLVSRGRRFAETALPARSYNGAQSTLTLATLETWIRRGQFPVPARVSESELQRENAVLDVSASPRRSDAAGVTFVDAHTPTCVHLYARASIEVHLGATNVLRMVPEPSPRFSPSSPIVMRVSLLSDHVAAGTHVDVVMGPSDRWLSLPGGGYATAELTPVNDTVLVCEASARRSA
jgi:hypothetical protein